MADETLRNYQNRKTIPTTEMTTIRPYIIPGLILVILILSFISLRQCEKAKELVADDSKTELLQKVAEKQARIAQQDSAIQRAAESRIRMQLEFEGLKTSLNASVVFWKGKAKQGRPQVIVLADSIPVLKAYIEATDSVIVKQDSVIEIQALHLVNQSKLYELEIQTMAGRHIQAMELVETWKSAAVEREKDLKKETRRKKFFRSTAMVLGACVAVLILAK